MEKKDKTFTLSELLLPLSAKKLFFKITKIEVFIKNLD